MHLSGPVVTRIAVLILGFTLCHVSNAGKRHHRRSTSSSDVHFLDFRFEAEPIDKLLVDGSSDGLLLDCHYAVNTEFVNHISAEWRKDGSTITNNKEKRLLSNSSLFIERPRSGDVGLYQCAVRITSSNGHIWTYVSRKASVRFEELPKFQSQPTDQHIARGHPVVFHCLIPSFSSVTMLWYHNDRLISAKDGYHILPVTNSLEISSVQHRHEGEYKCVAEGADKRRTSQTGRLTVLATSESTSNMITFLSEPFPRTALEGENVLLECLVTAFTVPEIRWLKDARQVLVDGSRIRRVGVSSLMISSATLDDAGLYTCRASNGEDSEDRTVLVNVNVAPVISTRPQSKVAVETADVEFECLASGRPVPSISWYKNGEVIIASEYFVVESNRLRILGLVKTDQGIYQCVASNLIGSQQASAQLIVESAGPTYLSAMGIARESLQVIRPMSSDDSSSVAASSGLPLLPSAPLGLRSQTIGSRLLSLEWDSPIQVHGSVMRYHVLYKEEDVNRERQVNVSSPSVTLTSLQPNTLYIIRVAAENEAGLGKFSDHIKIHTKRELAVPGAVTNLRAEAISSETIEVRWNPPESGPAALRYKIFYIRHPPNGEVETQTITTEATTSYTFHGLEKYTEYRIRVEADGENGSGVSSDFVSVRTLSDVPREPPRDVVAEPASSTSVLVKWKEPLEGVNGEITGYRVRYKTKQRGSKGNTFVVDATEREYAITGLDRDTQYLVKVAVMNHNGTGEFSDWVHVATPLHDKEEALLGAPRELRPQPGPDYIILSWLPPSDESVLVREYEVGWGHNVPDVYRSRVSGSVLSYKIEGLKPGKDYVVSLRGSNRKGLGFPIYETVRTLLPSAILHDELETLINPAMTPVSVKAESKSATSILVTWTDPDPSAFNTQYTVRYSSSVDGQQIRSKNCSETHLEIEGLRPATEYEFSVRAIGGESVSQWSMAVRARTLSTAPSSAPRDLTVLPAASGDPHSVSLSWQPPKYGNGEIEEYLIYYTDRASLPDRDWTVNYVPGDRLGHHVSNLLPRAVYYFKMQARNEKGYGPMSSIQDYKPKGVPTSPVNANPSENQWAQLIRIISAQPLYLIAIIGIAILLILFVVLITICVSRGSTPTKNEQASRKSTERGAGDLWINHPSGSHMRGAPSDYMVDGMGLGGALLTERLTGPEVVDSPPPRYQPLQDSAYGSVSVGRHSRTPVRASVSSMEDDPRRGPIVGRAKPLLASVHSHSGMEDSQGTLSRSYHHSSSSLEATRQRTPQVVYTGTGRHQPIAKVDLSESPYGSSSAIHSATPPIPTQAPPSGPPVVDGYRTLRGTPPGSGNPLRSFTQIAAAAPRPPPMVIAAGGKQLPVGRATAQPRVNITNIYSPYASCSESEFDKKANANDIEMQPANNISSELQPSNSTEELNAQMENLDTMIDDLQKFQHEFGVNGQQPV